MTPTIQDPYSQRKSLATWLVDFLVRLQAKHHIPDTALSALLIFLYTVFCVLGRFSGVAAAVAAVFPRSLRALRSAVGCDDNFQTLIVCSKCHKLYTLEDCVTKTGATKTSRCCSHVKYPNHLRRSGRAPCGTLLLRTIQLRSGRTFLYPFKVYCFRSLRTSLQELLLRPGFFDACQLWQSPATNGHELSDVYDGKIWKDFQYYDGEPFLALSTGIALMLNIDWFQPYSHTVLSIGVIYLVVMNLPRSTRFKRQNVIIVGVIPGPSEPKHDIINYLEPLVKSFMTCGLDLECLCTQAVLL